MEVVCNSKKLKKRRNWKRQSGCAKIILKHPLLSVQKRKLIAILHCRRTAQVQQFEGISTYSHWLWIFCTVYHNHCCIWNLVYRLSALNRLSWACRQSIAESFGGLGENQECEWWAWCDAKKKLSERLLLQEYSQSHSTITFKLQEDCLWNSASWQPPWPCLLYRAHDSWCVCPMLLE